ncbi:MAG TPA: hypothetical protein VIL86_07930 [Tepidisphaeraceae bacterium]|jgi:hypothetical protein
MREIASTAQRLKAVHKAHEHFLALWALECLMKRPLDRIAEDLSSVAHDSPPVQKDDTPLYRGRCQE